MYNFLCAHHWTVIFKLFFFQAVYQPNSETVSHACVFCHIKVRVFWCSDCGQGVDVATNIDSPTFLLTLTVNIIIYKIATDWFNCEIININFIFCALRRLENHVLVFDGKAAFLLTIIHHILMHRGLCMHYLIISRRKFKTRSFCWVV